MRGRNWNMKHTFAFNYFLILIQSLQLVHMYKLKLLILGWHIRQPTEEIFFSKRDDLDITQLYIDGDFFSFFCKDKWWGLLSIALLEQRSQNICSWSWIMSPRIHAPRIHKMSMEDLFLQDLLGHGSRHQGFMHQGSTKCHWKTCSCKFDLVMDHVTKDPCIKADKMSMEVRYIRELNESHTLSN